MTKKLDVVIPVLNEEVDLEPNTRILHEHMNAHLGQFEWAIVIADNVAGGAEDEQPYARWVRDPDNGFVSSSIVMKGGTEYSVWVGGS